MEFSFREEEKYSIDNVEVPVQCIVMEAFKENLENAPVMELHYHDYVEILYGLDCDLTVWCYGTKYNLKSGGLVLVNSQKSAHRHVKFRLQYVCCNKVYAADTLCGGTVCFGI